MIQKQTHTPSSSAGSARWANAPCRPAEPGAVFRTFPQPLRTVLAWKGRGLDRELQQIARHKPVVTHVAMPPVSWPEMCADPDARRRQLRLGIIMIAAAVIHLRLHEPWTAGGNAILLALCAFVAIGRWP